MSPFDNVPENVSKQVSDFQADATNVSTQDLVDRMGGGEALNNYRDIDPTNVGFKGQMGAGVDNKALADAVNRRALRKFRTDRAGVKQNIESQAIQMKMNRLTEAAKLTGAELQQNKRAEMNRYIRRQQRKSARAGVVGNVLGIVGAVVGGVYGGPAGAAAGSQIGQAAGNAIGG